ncbi:MAG TPA: excinuclease ABC subunit A, partial [Pirellulaceae bacterium]
MKSEDVIQLRGVSVHNLQAIDLDIPREKLVVICGVSGSGKTSLAMDTLFAEGQRRFVESFSAYSRQFLARMPRPQAERIEGIPPAVAMGQIRSLASARGSLGSLTEISDFLRVLYAKASVPHCPRCAREIRPLTAEQAAIACENLPPGTRYQVTDEERPVRLDDVERLIRICRERGAVRWIVGETLVRLDDSLSDDVRQAAIEGPVFVVRDRLVAGESPSSRVRESFAAAMNHGQGVTTVWIASPGADVTQPPFGALEARTLEGQTWLTTRFDSRLRCPQCEIELPEPEPRLFRPDSPEGACPRCQGSGTVWKFDPALAIPEPNKSLSEGAIAPWNSPSYRGHFEALLAVATHRGIPLHAPYRNLSDEAKRLVREGTGAGLESDPLSFVGLDTFFADLEQRAASGPVDKFLHQWRSPVPCPECHGTRLSMMARVFTIGGRAIHELSNLPVSQILRTLQDVRSTDAISRAITETILAQVRSRLEYLEFVGLGYLPLDRELRTLSSGELQRVALTKALGSSLVNLLYVLDEPSAGLHPVDVERVIGAITLLRDRGNSVVVVEHDEAILSAADRVIEIGPAAGEAGGRVTFEGSVAQLRRAKDVLTGEYLSGRRGRGIPEQRR